jgi:hypothetical protein
VSANVEQKHPTHAEAVANGPRPLTVASALALIEMGLVPVRVEYSGKRPTEHGWPDLRPTPAQVAAWGVCNVGALLGKASRWLTDIDLDSPEARALAPFYLPVTWVFGRNSSPRSHWLYFAEGVTSKKFTDDNEVTVVEIRGEASTGSAHQTVLPQSVHVSGEAIDWDADLGDGMVEPLTIDGRELVTAVCRLTRATLFARAGLSLDDARAAEAAHKPQRPEQPEARRLPMRSEGNVRERARRYLAKMPEGVAGQGGHLATFRAAVVLVRGFDLGAADALDLLSEYNQRCAPPWSERELAHKIKQAARARVPAGYLLGGDR